MRKDNNNNIWRTSLSFVFLLTSGFLFLFFPFSLFFLFFTFFCFLFSFPFSFSLAWPTKQLSSSFSFLFVSPFFYLFFFLSFFFLFVSFSFSFLGQSASRPSLLCFLHAFCLTNTNKFQKKTKKIRTKECGGSRWLGAPVGVKPS